MPSEKEIAENDIRYENPKVGYTKRNQYQVSFFHFSGKCAHGDSSVSRRY